MELTDKEIIKALECCIESNSCSKCPFANIADVRNCTSKLSKNTLNIINRLQAENEGLKAEVELLHSDYTYKLVKNKAKAEAEAEAYKEFADEIFELFPADKPNTVISRVTVKHILKELVGE